MKAFRALIVLCCVSTAPVGNAQIVQPVQGLAPAGRRVARCDRQLPLEQLQTGIRPTRAAVGDLDGDGHFDLVSANGGNYNSGTLTVCLNRGNGRFATPVHYTSTDWPVSSPCVALADFNGDGDLDAATAGGFALSASLYFNAGDGTFGSPVTLLGDGLSVAIQAADVDGDGDIDLAIAGREPDAVTVFKNDGRGEFTEFVQHTMFGDPAALLLLDVDADGDVDMVTVNDSSDTFSVRINSGEGLFNLHHLGSIGMPVDEFAAGFLDGDGVRDFAVVSAATSSVQIVRYLGGTSFVVHSSVALPFTPVFVSVGDVDGDVDRDLVVTGDDLAVLENDGTGHYTIAGVYTSTGSHWTGTVLADFDGDGARDAAAVDEFGGNNLTLFPNRGDGSFPMPTFLSTGPLETYSPAASLADLDGDGDRDVAVAVDGHGTFVAKNNGDGTFAAGATYAGGGRELTLADLDGDGDADVASTHHNSNPLLTLGFNAGDGTFGPAVGIAVSASASQVEAADLDGDLDLDLVVASPSGVSVFVNQGGGTFAAEVLYDSADVTQRRIVLADVDADGDRDVAVAKFTTSAVAVLRNNGDGTFAAPEPYPSALRPLAIVAGDFDRDGDVDLAVTRTNSSTVLELVVYANQGGGTFVAGAATPSTVDMTGLTAADVDHDGRTDLLLTRRSASAASSVIVLHGAGDGSFPTRRAYGTFLGFSGNSTSVGDLNGDARNDIVVSGPTGQSILLTTCR